MVGSNLAAQAPRLRLAVSDPSISAQNMAYLLPMCVLMTVWHPGSAVFVFLPRPDLLCADGCLASDSLLCSQCSQPPSLVCADDCLASWQRSLCVLSWTRPLMCRRLSGFMLPLFFALNKSLCSFPCFLPSTQPFAPSLVCADDCVAPRQRRLCISEP